MKRVALCIGFPYAAGLLIASVVHSRLWFAALGAMALLAAAVLLYRKAAWKYVLLSTLSALTACCVYWCYNGLYVQKLLQYPQLEETVFTGTITSRTVYDSGNASYLLEGTFCDGQAATIQYFCDNTGYAYGDALTLTGSVEEVSSGYLFDAASYYQSRNVFLQMQQVTDVRHSPRVNITLRSLLYEWRGTMSSRIADSTGEESGAFLTGMLFGDKTGMSASTKTSLYRMGVGHVLAVSGLHLDFLALCIMGVLRKCRVDRRLSFGIMAFLALLFVLCVGETVSVKRACIMILISQSAGLFFRKADTLNSISIAMLLLCLENPMVIHNAGFWLSFSGAFGIGVLAPYMTAPLPDTTMLQKGLKQVLALFCVFLAVLPASALYFREVSLISPLSNLLLVPLCMLALLLTVLALLLGGAQGFLAEPILQTADGISALVLNSSRKLAGYSWTHCGTENRTAVSLLALTAAAVLLCYLLYRSRKWMCITASLGLAMTCVCSGAEQLYTARDLRIAVLGDGNHCVLVIRMGKEAVVADASGTSQLASYVQAYLQSSGTETVQTLYLCNPGIRSFRNYNELLTFCPPGKVCSVEAPEDVEHPEIAGTPVTVYQECEALFGGAWIRVSDKEILVEYGGVSFACCKADAETIPESDILTIYGRCGEVLPDCGILIVLDENAAYEEDASTWVGQNNLELTITPEGECRVRSLYADS